MNFSVRPSAGRNKNRQRRHFFRSLALGVGFAWIAPLALSAPVPAVRHEPLQPKSGEAVRITADFKNLARPQELLLEYQSVDPGKYIALSDSAYKTFWVQVKMNDAGESGDTVGGDGIFTIKLPAALQKHRRLIRYRIWSPVEKKIIAPDAKDEQPNFAYFAYDGVPAWRGAINARSSDTKLREVVTFSSNVLQQVPVYHFIGSKSSVEKATWYEPTSFGGGGFGGILGGRMDASRDPRHEYRYTGTIVYDGIVYDHVKFRARGGAWRHAMGKNMWKFNFLPGHRFQARDFYGNPYHAKWDKLNLGACIQQGDYGMRGEQGMFEAVGFRLFNLAGMEASHTHWIHLRIIDQAEENPADQYAGDFWGLYLATENVDEHFLKEHNLPAGNLYKMEFGAKTAFNGDPTITNKADVNAFMTGTMRGQPAPSWWQSNVDLPRYYNYRSILECIHHYDVDAGKNYYYYLNPVSRKWIVLPWDIDLSWGDRMYGGGREPFFRSGLLFRSPFKEAYQDRLAEIRDLLFNAEQLGWLIDEHAGMISDPKGGLSIVDADRAKWDFHPILASSHVDPSKAGQGRFYFGNPRNSFRTMIQYMKSYAARRMTWIDQQLLSDYRPPPAPTISVGAGALRFQTATKPNNLTNGNVRWRLAEISDPSNPTFTRREPWKYEINSMLDKELKVGQAFEPPANLVAAGHIYRVRARTQDTDGRWSRWSAPVQFVGANK